MFKIVLKCNKLSARHHCPPNCYIAKSSGALYRFASILRSLPWGHNLRMLLRSRGQVWSFCLAELPLCYRPIKSRYPQFDSSSIVDQAWLRKLWILVSVQVHLAIPEVESVNWVDSVGFRRIVQNGQVSASSRICLKEFGNPPLRMKSTN